MLPAHSTGGVKRVIPILTEALVRSRSRGATIEARSKYPQRFSHTPQAIVKAIANIVSQIANTETSPGALLQAAHQHHLRRCAASAICGSLCLPVCPLRNGTRSRAVGPRKQGFAEVNTADSTPKYGSFRRVYTRNRPVFGLSGRERLHGMRAAFQAKSGAGIPNPALLVAVPSSLAILLFAPTIEHHPGLPHSCTSMSWLLLNIRLVQRPILACTLARVSELTSKPKRANSSCTASAASSRGRAIKSVWEPSQR
jgi:hypothetical protein